MRKRTKENIPRRKRKEKPRMKKRSKLKSSHQ
jgi:hypothetical protein